MAHEERAHVDHCASGQVVCVANVVGRRGVRRAACAEVADADALSGEADEEDWE